MSSLVKKFDTLSKILYKNKMTKPCKMGEKILLLATAPCANDFFENESVQKQFENYDLAFINYMIFYSQDAVFKMKPKYFVLIDPIFYKDDYFENMKQADDRIVEKIDYERIEKEHINPEKEKVVEILERIDWECYVVTTVLADFGIKNNNVHYIRLSCFGTKYKSNRLFLLRRNWANLGMNNVIHGALYFAITFGYKNIAILGCTYKNLNMHMEEDGLHILEHNHYYNLKQEEFVLSNEDLSKRNESYIGQISKRAVISSECLWNLKEYARLQGAVLTNYSRGSMIDAIPMGKLDI